MGSRSCREFSDAMDDERLGAAIVAELVRAKLYSCAPHDSLVKSRHSNVTPTIVIPTKSIHAVRLAYLANAEVEEIGRGTGRLTLQRVARRKAQSLSA